MKAKLGFVKEGVLRKHWYHKGEYRDAELYNLLKEDYKIARQAFVDK
jgi:RimJ/RimL family protein N-acetyltransferase